jgi:hypothetical protein
VGQYGGSITVALYTQHCMDQPAAVDRCFDVPHGTQLACGCMTVAEGGRVSDQNDIILLLAISYFGCGGSAPGFEQLIKRHIRRTRMSIILLQRCRITPRRR